MHDNEYKLWRGDRMKGEEGPANTVTGRRMKSENRGMEGQRPEGRGRKI